MKAFDISLCTLAFCALVVSSADAQQIRNPAKRVGYTYGYYGIGQPPEVEPSPSDVKPEPKKDENGAANGAEEPANGKGWNGCDENGNGCDENGNGCDENGNGCDENGDDCECPCYLFGPDEPWTLFGTHECSGLTIGGWLEFGYHDQQVPLSVTRGDALSFRDVPDTFTINQAWIYFEKDADGDCCCWDWGYRVDVVYGTDAQKTQAFGNPPGIPGGGPRGWDNQWDHGVYGWAIPQAYIELDRGDLSVIAGHFFTLVGYEVIPAPENFFYSHALTMFNSEPFTHTGVLATYSGCEDLEVYAGWTLGWDTGFDQFEGGSSWLGGFSSTLTEDITFTYISTAGDFGLRGGSGYSHSMVFDVTLTDKLQYVLQSDFVYLDSDTRNAGANTDQVGINQYLFYTINDCFSLGTRLEWWKTDGVSFNEVTFGANYKPHANFTIRPEVRHDWQGNLVNAAGVPIRDTTNFGIDMIFTF